jgi:membrane protein
MKALLERLRNSFPGRLAKAYGDSKAGNYAAGLAFNAFMTMFPLMLGLLAILGLFIGNPHFRDQAESTLLSIFPANAHQELSAALSGVQKNRGLLGLLSIVGLVWSGTGFFAAMEFALGEMFGARQRDMVRQRLMRWSWWPSFWLPCCSRWSPTPPSPPRAAASSCWARC